VQTLRKLEEAQCDRHHARVVVVCTGRRVRHLLGTILEVGPTQRVLTSRPMRHVAAHCCLPPIQLRCGLFCFSLRDSFDSVWHVMQRPANDTAIDSRCSCGRNVLASGLRITHQLEGHSTTMCTALWRWAHLEDRRCAACVRVGCSFPCSHFCGAIGYDHIDAPALSPVRRFVRWTAWASWLPMERDA